MLESTIKALEEASAGLQQAATELIGQKRINDAQAALSLTNEVNEKIKQVTALKERADKPA